MTQTERIMEHLKKYGSITQLEALDHYGIMRLASRISDLKRAGYPIRKEMEHVKNRYGEAVSFAVYRMEEV